MKRLLWLLLCLPSFALANVITLSWVPALAYTDGSTELATDIGSSTVQYGPCSATTPLTLASVTGTFTAQGGKNSAQSPDLPAGTYCFEVTTNSLLYGPGVPSDAISFTVVVKIVPGPPSSVKAQ